MSKKIDFDHVYRMRNIKENQNVVGLRESEKLIGQLYPVLVDEDGNVLDGQHRLKVNPDWKKEVIKGIDSDRQRAMIRIHANWHRRKMYPEQVLMELAKITGWKGAAPYAAFLGCSVRTVQRYLPQEFKMRQRISYKPGDFPKRQLSLSEKEGMTAYEVELRQKLSEEETKGRNDYWTLKRLEEGKPEEEWPKDRLLHFLGNRIYNNVTCRKEPPEELINSLEIKEDCAFYLKALTLLKTPRDEILNHLREQHQRQIRWLEEHQKLKEKERTFKNKIDELYAKFKQITVEFIDGKSVPLNLNLLHCTTIGFYDEHGRNLRPGDKGYAERFLKDVILAAIVKEMLGFDEGG